MIHFLFQAGGMENKLFALMFGLLTQLVSTEVFTAISEMDQLFDTEAAFVAILESYTGVERFKLGMLERYLTDFKTQLTMAKDDVEGYLNNPINAYLITKRLTTDLRHVEALMESNFGQVFLSDLKEQQEKLKFPTDEDLKGAVVALMRLQDTYKLSTSSMARGELNGVQYSTNLTSDDCFQLARQSFQDQGFHHARLWSAEAIKLYHAEVFKRTKLPDILDILSFSAFKEGDIHLALKITNQLLELDPGNTRIIGNKVYYEKAVETGDAEKVRVMTSVEKIINGKKSEDLKNTYESLCRGEIGPTEIVKSKLKCRYKTSGFPYLKIGPLKEEEAYLNPRIIIYHDAMSDEEIRALKELSKPRFERASVRNRNTGEKETADYRISKSAWLGDYESKHVESVTRRTEYMTGLTATTAEYLQTVNYGIGGHYEQHFDFAVAEDGFKEYGVGNRIATVLFYMSDVLQGGSTVFLSSKVAIRPKKGTAVVWMNLKPSGEGDYSTRHAACPVLVGSKWVSNKWFHERGQEFRRPCALTKNGFDTTHNF